MTVTRAAVFNRATVVTAAARRPASLASADFYPFSFSTILAQGLLAVCTFTSVDTMFTESSVTTTTRFADEYTAFAEITTAILAL